MDVGITPNAHDFMVYWVTNCVHAEGYQRDGDESAARELENRCIAMAADEGFTKTQLEHAVGDLLKYISSNITRVNDEEAMRLSAEPC